MRAVHGGPAGRGRRPGPPRPGLPDRHRGDGPGNGRPSGHRGGSAVAAAACPRFGSFMQWSLPFGAVSAANWLAMVAQRRMHEFGLTREQMGQIAINGRRNAAFNPKAIYSDPMTMEDYLAARMITTPLCLFDCDAPCDGSTAVIVSHRDVAGDLDHPRGAHQRARHRPARPAELGPVRRHDHHGGPRRRGLHVGAHRADAGRRRHRPALRRLLGADHRVARGARLLRPRRERAVHRGRGRHRPRRRSCRSTPPGASSRAAACTASASSTRRACSCAARAASARWCAPGAARPRWPRWRTAAGPSPAPCC